MTAPLVVYSSDVGGDLDLIYLLNPATLASPQLIATPGKRAWEPSLSPDGQWVVLEAHGASTAIAMVPAP